jgi:hypothetical protein
MTPAFAPEAFATPVVSPDTSTLFRRTPYISPEEYMQAPTAVAVSNLVPGGTKGAQEAALAAVIMRASDLVDTLAFHRADGTFAASPSTESGWVTPKPNSSLALICNYKPILEVDAVALGTGANSSMRNIGQQGAENLTIDGPIIYLQSACFGSYGPATFFPSGPTINGKIYAVWTYVNGFPHVPLAAEAKAGKSVLTVGPSNPGGSVAFGIYPGTQLTIHDGESTEVIVVSSIEGLTLTLTAPLLYTHKVPTLPGSIRVSAVPWSIEQATISLVSYLIKRRGSRAMILPQTPGGQAKGQAEGQAGGTQDWKDAVAFIKPFMVPVMRST